MIPILFNLFLLPCWCDRLPSQKPTPQADDQFVTPLQTHTTEIYTGTGPLESSHPSSTMSSSPEHRAGKRPSESAVPCLVRLSPSFMGTPHTDRVSRILSPESQVLVTGEWCYGPRADPLAKFWVLTPLAVDRPHPTWWHYFLSCLDAYAPTQRKYLPPHPCYPEINTSTPAIGT